VDPAILYLFEQTNVASLIAIVAPIRRNWRRDSVNPQPNRGNLAAPPLLGSGIV